MQPSIALAHFLAQPDIENCVLTSYQDGGGVWTIGCGHTAGVTEGMTCTYEQAMEWLIEDMGSAAKSVNRLLTAPLSQNQFDAFVSLGFNIGNGNLATSSSITLFNQGEIGLAAEHFLLWDKVDGIVEGGLVKRRKCEAIILLGQPWEISQFAGTNSYDSMVTLSRCMSAYA